MITARKAIATMLAVAFFALAFPVDPASAEAVVRQQVDRVTPPSGKTSWIARLVAPTKAFSGPGTGRVVDRLGARARWNGGPAAFLILNAEAGPDGRRWLQVSLPRRPNGTRGWIDADRTRISSTPWRIRVDLGNRTVTLIKGGRAVARDRAVIGSAANPTPTGLFAISERVRQPDPDRFLGSWALLLTAHSNTLRRFDGGPGQVAIHGRGGASLSTPLGSASSHGCVRIDNRPVSRIAAVAREGTPVKIRR